jgi:hypothetical protein
LVLPAVQIDLGKGQDSGGRREGNWRDSEARRREREAGQEMETARRRRAPH